MSSQHANGTARPGAAPEPADFTARLRGLSPQEVLGAVDGTGLAKPFVVSAVGSVVLLIGLTIGPYLAAKSAGDAPKPAPATGTTAAPVAESPKPEPSQPAAAPTDVAKTPPAVKPEPGKPAAAKDVLEKLGESGTKTASPKVNPLENKGDDLFKDLDGK